MLMDLITSDNKKMNVISTKLDRVNLQTEKASQLN